MAAVTVHAAKTNLSQLLARVEAGEEIVLARGAVPIAKLVPLEPHAPRRRFGAMRGQVQLDAAFFEPMSEEELQGWGS